jgi:hypothetical protein
VERHGVILISEDTASTAFVADLIEQSTPEAGCVITLSDGKVCLAVVAGTRRRRLVLIDGQPPAVAVGILVEAIRITDSQVPIVFVRYPCAPPPEKRSTGGNVYVISGPLASDRVEQLVVALLRDPHRDRFDLC